MPSFINPMMNKGLVIYTGKIRTGKTSALKRVLEGQAVGGILSPDIKGKRCFELPGSSRRFELEVDGHVAYDAALHIRVGRFVFLREAFEMANRTLVKDMHGDKDWLVVDELGKLEIKGEGLADGIQELLRLYKTGRFNKFIVIVIRDYLLDEAISKYELDEASIIYSAEELSRHLS